MSASSRSASRASTASSSGYCEDSESKEEKKAADTPQRPAQQLQGSPSALSTQSSDASVGSFKDWWPNDEDLGRSPAASHFERQATHAWLVRTLEGVRRGDAEAMYALGVEYKAYPRARVKRDMRRARRLLELAAALGHARALVELGSWHEHGIFGATHDERRALEQYTRAAEAGEPSAQHVVGTLHYYGRCGLKRDDEAAARYFALAAGGGHAEAQARLGSCLHEGRGVPRDLNAALHQYRQAAANGNAVAGKWASDLETMLKLAPSALAEVTHNEAAASAKSASGLRRRLGRLGRSRLFSS